MYRTRGLGLLFNSLIYSTLPAGQVNLHARPDVQLSKVFWDFVFLVSPFQSHFPTSFFFFFRNDGRCSRRYEKFVTRNEARQQHRLHMEFPRQNPRRVKKIEKIRRDNKNLNFFLLPFRRRETDRMDRPWKKYEEKEGKKKWNAYRRSGCSHDEDSSLEASSLMYCTRYVLLQLVCAAAV